MEKYKIWMIQEGNEKKIKVFCTGCGKHLTENATFYSDQTVIVCSRACEGRIDEKLVRLQADRFAIEALKAVNLVV